MKLFFSVPVECKELHNDVPEIEMELVELRVSKKNFNYVANLLKRRLCDSANPIEHGIRFVPSIEKQERAADTNEVA